MSVFSKYKSDTGQQTVTWQHRKTCQRIMKWWEANMVELVSKW